MTTGRSSLVLLLLALLLEAGYLALRRLGDFQQWLPEFVGVSLAISLFYLVSCWWITRTSGQGANRNLAFILVAGLVFRFTLLAVYPSLSEDPHRYRWEGKLQAAGGNPYRERPDDPRWARLRDRTWHAVNRKDFRAGYGPLLQWLQRLTYAAVSRLTADEFRQVQYSKAPYLLFDVATAGVLLLLLDRLGRPRSWALVYFWSPLPVVEFWAGGHNDPVVVFLIVTAIWAGLSRRWGLAFGALWLAALSKFWPFLLFPLFLWSGGLAAVKGRALRAAAWIPVAAAISLPYADGARELLRTLSGLAAGWRNNASLYNVIHWIAGGDYERGRPMVGVLLVVVALAVAARRPSLPRGALWIIVASLFLSANCFPWYLTWFLPLMAVRAQPALLLWTALAPLSYHVVIPYALLGLWQEDPFYLVLEYVPVFAMLAVSGWRRAPAAPAIME